MMYFGLTLVAVALWLLLGVRVAQEGERFAVFDGGRYVGLRGLVLH